MANSPVPAHQTFATQIPSRRMAGERVYVNPVRNEVPVVQAVTTVAATGSTTADAALLGVVPFQRVTGADATKGVRLQPAAIGSQMEIHNDAAAALKLYPPTGGKINGGTTNASVNVAANSPTRIRNIDGTNWSVG
jgi:hypothetical protein